MSVDTTDWIPITIRYRGRCVECGKEMTSGLALWSKSTKTIRHLDCSGKVAEIQSSDVKSVSKQNAYSQAILFECFICGKEECHEYEYDIDMYYSYKGRRSDSYICQSCLGKKNAFETYRQTFLRKIKRYTK